MDGQNSDEEEETLESFFHTVEDESEEAEPINMGSAASSHIHGGSESFKEKDSFNGNDFDIWLIRMEGVLK